MVEFAIYFFISRLLNKHLTVNGHMLCWHKVSWYNVTIPYSSPSGLTTNGDFHNYGTRNRDLLRKPYGGLKQFKNLFIYNGIDLWNILPNYTKSAPTRKIFINRIKIIMYKNEI